MKIRMSNTQKVTALLSLVAFFFVVFLYTTQAKQKQRVSSLLAMNAGNSRIENVEAWIVDNRKHIDYYVKQFSPEYNYDEIIVSVRKPGSIFISTKLVVRFLFDKSGKIAQKTAELQHTGP